MKKLLLFVAIAVMTISNAQSQELRIGAKAGVNFASVGGDFTDNYDGRTSFHIGGLVEIPISENFPFNLNFYIPDKVQNLNMITVLEIVW